MTTTRRASRRALIALASGLVLLGGTGAAGCAQPGSPEEGTGNNGLPSTDLIVQVRYTGGFVPVETLLTNLPLVSIYADGRVITEGPQIMIYPAPALPNLQMRTISSGEVDTLRDVLLQAGVGKEIDYGSPAIADAPTTVITVRSSDGVAETEVYALSESGTDDPNLTEAQRIARDRLKSALEQVTAVNSSAETEQYHPQAVAAIASLYVPRDGEAEPPEIAWPGPALPGTPLPGFGERSCVTASGADATAVLEGAAQANMLTPWTYGDERWHILFRPLLPHESDCASLQPS